MADFGDIDGSEDFIRRLKLTAQQIGSHLYRAHYRMGELVKREAIMNAPKSPTQQDLDAWRKALRDARGKGDRTPAQQAADKARKKDRATSRPNPGGLMRSISMTANKHDAEIFVASNSEAGKYAVRMHDEKGKTWKRRGPGTIAKGPRADEKFILRAIRENEQNLVRIAEDQMNKAIEQANRGTT